MSLSTSLTTVGSPEEAKTDKWFSNAWIVKNKSIYPAITFFSSWMQLQLNDYLKMTKQLDTIETTLCCTLLFYVYSKMHSYNISTH